MSPSDTLPPSAHFPRGCPVIAPTTLPAISHRGGEGLSSCATRPCHHAAANHPAGVRTTLLPDTSSPCCLRLPVANSASGSSHSRGHLAFTVLRPGDSLPSHGWACQRASEISVSLLPAAQATEVLALPPVGLTPTERVRVSLDAQPDMNLSGHPAPIAQPSGPSPNRQCAKRLGLRRATRATNPSARRG
jgi:hypothetical protein